MHMSICRWRTQKHTKGLHDESDHKHFDKARYPQGRCRLPFRSRLNGDHLFVLRLSEVVSVRGAGADPLYKPWSSDLLDVFGIQCPRRDLVPGSFRMAVWCTPVLGLLEQESRNSWCARFLFFVYRDVHNHPILPKRLGSVCWRGSSNDRTRRFSHEGSSPVRSFILFASGRPKTSFAACDRIIAVGSRIPSERPFVHSSGTSGAQGISVWPILRVSSVVFNSGR